MKPTDATAIIAGATAGTAISDSVEQVVASIGAAIAVYLVNALLKWITAKLKIENTEE